MCRKAILSQSSRKGFFSLDAALAFTIAVFAFSSFALIFSSAASSANSQAGEISGSHLALRLSSYVMEQAAVSSDSFLSGGYYSANEIDLPKLYLFDLGGILAQTGKTYAKISLHSEPATLFSAEEGEKQAETFCASRLVLVSGEIMRLESCIS